MHRRKERHGQAASALSETRSKYVLDPSKLPSLGRGLRRPEQGPCGGSEVCSGTRQNFPGLGRGLRGPEQVLDWLRAVCADPNRAPAGAAKFVRVPGKTSPASAEACADPNRHSIGASGTPARFAGYKANSTSFLYQANSPSLGRGLREAKRMNALPL